MRGLATLVGCSGPAVWVKRMDVDGASWTKLSNNNKWVDVDELRAAVIVAQARSVAIDPSLVELKLVSTKGKEKPTDSEELSALTLDSTLTWAEILAGREKSDSGRVWLLAVVNKAAHADSSSVLLSAVPRLLHMDDDPSVEPHKVFNGACGFCGSKKHPV